MINSILVYGSGAFGTALALSCQRAGRNVTLFCRNEEKAREMREKRINPLYLPNIFLPEEIFITSDKEKIRENELILLATPSQALTLTLQTLMPYLKESCPLVICAKGIDQSSNKLLSEVARKQVSNPIVFLSGPSFAIEIAKNNPTAVMLASENLDLAYQISQSLHHHHFRCYVTDDIIGIQIAGAVKNVIAIASGILTAQSYGMNTRAALLSRGLSEMCRLGVAMGAKQDTFLSLAGVGDLILTATSDLSRNFRFGHFFAQNRSCEKTLREMDHTVIEGMIAAQALKNIAEKYQVRMPICQSVYDLLYTQKTLEEITTSLLSTPSYNELI